MRFYCTCMPGIKGAPSAAVDELELAALALARICIDQDKLLSICHGAYCLAYKDAHVRMEFALQVLSAQLA